MKITSRPSHLADLFLVVPVNRTSLSRFRPTTLSLLLSLGLSPLALQPAQGQGSTAYGEYALANNTNDNYYNSAFGCHALRYNTTGYYNTAVGFYTLKHNNGNANTGVGWSALQFNTTGGLNSAFGNVALNQNTTGSNNTATGASALVNNTTGSNNTATGVLALASNTTGYANAATGTYSLYSNTTGTWNTATGFYSLYSNTTGIYNSGHGLNALALNTTGSYNTANGYAALYTNSIGNSNVADGSFALFQNTTGANNTVLGYQAGYNITTGSNNIAIGNTATSNDNGVIRLGNQGTQKATFIAGINGVTAKGGVPVFVNANGQLGTLRSSRRFKQNIKDMGTVSEKLMQLRPVTFRYKDNAEAGPHALQYGLIAEEVAKVYPDLVQYDKAGKPFTIYYHLLTPMLLNELQKEHRRNVEQRTEIAAMKTAFAKQAGELASLKTAHEQEMKMLAKLAAFVQTAHTTKSATTQAVMARR